MNLRSQVSLDKLSSVQKSAKSTPANKNKKSATHTPKNYSFGIMTANKKLDTFEKRILDEKVTTLLNQNKQLQATVNELRDRNAQLEGKYQKDTKALKQQVKKLDDVIELEFVPRIDEL